MADKGYDADWFREALVDRGFEVAIPPKSNRKTQMPYDKWLCRKRHKIENMCDKLKDWCRIRTRCAHSFRSAIATAAIVIFWI